MPETHRGVGPAASFPELAGVGIDTEELEAFDRFDHSAIARASVRWLCPAERAWCAKQPSPARALLVVFCCREAAFKSSGGLGPVHEFALNMKGEMPVGSATWADAGKRPIEVAWRIDGGRVLALAAAGDLFGTIGGWEHSCMDQARRQCPPVA